jgi:hypothetical protein
VNGSVDQLDHDRVRGLDRCVAWLALIAGTVSYLHMHAGSAAWPTRAGLSADRAVGDGMIVAASTTLLADSRSGRKGWRAALGTAGRGQHREPGRQRCRGRTDADRPDNRGVADSSRVLAWPVVSVLWGARIPSWPLMKGGAPLTGRSASCKIQWRIEEEERVIRWSRLICPCFPGRPN